MYRERIRPARVELCLDPPHLPPTSSSRAQTSGLRYEAHAKDELDRRYGPEFIPGPWFKYWLFNGRECYCQPDGLLIRVREGQVTIIEIKSYHNEQAFGQLTNLYYPIVSVWLAGLTVRDPFCPPWRVGLCEVVKWYDSALILPIRVKMVKGVDLVQPGEFGIHIFNPRHPFKQAETSPRHGVYR